MTTLIFIFRISVYKTYNAESIGIPSSFIHYIAISWIFSVQFNIVRFRLIMTLIAICYMQPTYPSINDFVRMKYSFIDVLDSAGCDDLKL